MVPKVQVVHFLLADTARAHIDSIAAVKHGFLGLFTGLGAGVWGADVREKELVGLVCACDGLSAGRVGVNRWLERVGYHVQWW
jgi:hypothetical protein